MPKKLAAQPHEEVALQGYVAFVLGFGVRALDVGNYIAFGHVAPLLGVDFHKLTTESGRQFDNLAVGILDVAEKVAFGIFLADERLNAFDTFAIATDFPEHDAAFGSHNGVGFGVFDVKERGVRIGRNPKTKEEIEIPATRVPMFKAGKALKEAVAK